MGKIEVSALIKAIQESVSLLVSDGIAPRERITDPVNDAARVQDLESGYSTEIDDIVDNIPDVPPTPPAPTLPTVALATYHTGNYVTNCWPGVFLNVYDGAELVPYDSTKTHIARVSDGHGGWLEWQFSCIEYAGDLAIKNMTSDTLSTYAARLFSCSSTQAEIIYVYNSSNEKYQAFKFTLNETDYYYVADSVQSDWTDDLSSIGYSLEPTPQPVMVYIESGNLYYQSSVKNDTSKSNSYCYAIYDDENRTTPHVFDWGKRNVFGNVVNGEFIPAAVQTQAQFPSTTGANTGYRVCVNKRNSADINGYLWLAWNSYQDGYANFPPRYLMIYDDAISFWFNEDHSNKADPTYIDWNTGIDYDSNKTYEVLALVNSDGIKVDDEYLYSTTFTEQNGKLIIRITYYTSSFKPAARVVFYAEESE